ncbi:MAG: hypothetical protein PSX80_13845 [bacterium]|nr:hypothetical protein [bacterium]
MADPRVAKSAKDTSLFGEKKPFAGSVVWACAVYSLVPLVGVVFVPFIYLFGVVAVAKGDGRNRQSALGAMAAGLLILLVQLVLWWLLYAVPKWGVQV